MLSTITEISSVTILVSVYGVALYLFRGRARNILLGLGVAGIVWVSWTVFQPHLKIARKLRPDRDFKHEALFIEVESIIPNWSIDDPPITPHIGGIWGEQCLYPPGYDQDPDSVTDQESWLAYAQKRGLYVVNRYLSSVDAKHWFNWYERHFLSAYNRGDLIPGDSQKQITLEYDFSSETSKRWRFVCVDMETDIFTHTEAVKTIHYQSRCYYLAQYAEYVVLLDIPMEWQGEKLLTIEELIPMVEYIDEKMGQYLLP